MMYTLENVKLSHNSRRLQTSLWSHKTFNCHLPGRYISALLLQLAVLVPPLLPTLCQADPHSNAIPSTSSCHLLGSVVHVAVPSSSPLEASRHCNTYYSITMHDIQHHSTLQYHSLVVCLTLKIMCLSIDIFYQVCYYVCYRSAYYP